MNSSSGTKNNKDNDTLIDDVKDLIDSSSSISGNTAGRLNNELLQPESFEDRVKRIRAEDMELDMHLKKVTLFALLGFLILETLALFVLTFFQGFGIITIEEWTMRILTVSTIMQITFMLNIAVKYLFSISKSGKKNDSGK